MPASESVFQDGIRHNRSTSLCHSTDFSKCGCEMWPGVSSAVVLAGRPTIHSGLGLVSFDGAFRCYFSPRKCGEISHDGVTFIVCFPSDGHRSLKPAITWMDWTNEKAKTAKWKRLGDRALIILVGFLENLRITGCCRKSIMDPWCSVNYEVTCYNLYCKMKHVIMNPCAFFFWHPLSTSE